MRLPTVHVRALRFYRLPMRTRFPFRYGIATLTDLPHLIVAVDAEVDGSLVQGVSADGLPPKWFTKNPSTTFENDDLPSMLKVIAHAGEVACQMGPRSTFFAWWYDLYQAQLHWAEEHGLAPLLASLGVSLIERATLDALCRRLELPIGHVLRENLLGLDFVALRPELNGVKPMEVLPTASEATVAVRHTVGLGDPLSSLSQPRPDDDLPFTLLENIQTYGLRFFKIKLSGNVTHDQTRLKEIASIVRSVADAKITLDGNESYQTVSQFRDAWERWNADAELREFFLRCLLFVEQPIHRDHALDDEVGAQMRIWRDAPSMIIDESDAELSSLPRALALGYQGTSHKNCKGIVKGVLNAACIRYQRRRSNPLILSAEDLGNVGPVALLQDLAIVAALGIPHVERNGHHYFAGLSMFPEPIQQAMLSDHRDLYEDQHGFAALAVRNGELRLDSINQAPFGLRPPLPISLFESWSF